jgi:hypothetical protein
MFTFFSISPLSVEYPEEQTVDPQNVTPLDGLIAPTGLVDRNVETGERQPVEQANAIDQQPENMHPPHLSTSTLEPLHLSADTLLPPDENENMLPSHETPASFTPAPTHNENIFALHVDNENLPSQHSTTLDEESGNFRVVIPQRGDVSAPLILTGHSQIVMADIPVTAKKEYGGPHGFIMTLIVNFQDKIVAHLDRASQEAILNQLEIEDERKFASVKYAVTDRVINLLMEMSDGQSVPGKNFFENIVDVLGTKYPAMFARDPTKVVGGVIVRKFSTRGTGGVNGIKGIMHFSFKGTASRAEVGSETQKQCCGTGTGTVGTVTFCLVEPEPEP